MLVSCFIFYVVLYLNSKNSTQLAWSTFKILYYIPITCLFPLKNTSHMGLEGFEGE